MDGKNQYYQDDSTYYQTDRGVEHTLGGRCAFWRGWACIGLELIRTSTSTATQVLLYEKKVTGLDQRMPWREEPALVQVRLHIRKEGCGSGRRMSWWEGRGPERAACGTAGEGHTGNRADTTQLPGTAPEGVGAYRVPTQ